MCAGPVAGRVANAKRTGNWRDNMQDWLNDLLMTVVDGAMAVIPRRLPAAEALARCRLVSHRGENDGTLVRENTLRAFANASAMGVWGIECDIRWSADYQPVVCHDPDARRVFDTELVIADSPRIDIARLLPEVPSLEELLETFGGRNHLMLELKTDTLGGDVRKRDSLQRLLAPYTPGEDFHILALEPELFDLVDFLPPEACLPVAMTNTAQMSELALQRGYAGLAGHYLLLDRSIQRRHREAGQCVGTGFAASRNSLYREINRGVDWIFTNRAVELQRKLDSARARRGLPRSPL